MPVVCSFLSSCSRWRLRHRPKPIRTLLDVTLESYAGAIRWGNFEDAAGVRRSGNPQGASADQARPGALPPGAGHGVQRTAADESIGELEVRQIVEIGLVNINTQTARSIIDQQLWRYDEKAKRWWLVSGLPDITTH